MPNPITDNDVHSPEAWRRDLLAAGWTEHGATAWKDPEGRLWRGPYGAWRELQRRDPSGVEQKEHEQQI